MEILDESTGQIILKEQARVVYASPLSTKHGSDEHDITSSELDCEVIIKQVLI